MQQFFKFRKNRLNNIWLYICMAIVFFTVLLTGCASQRDHSLVYQQIRKNDYEKALKVLESNNEDFYGKTDEVLYLLDTGILNHYATHYAESNEKFSLSEKLIDYYYATSIGQSVSAWITNDLVKDYAGEDFEDIYGNIFMALNYIQLGMIEDAMVEIRRFDNKQRLLEAKYAETLSQTEQQLKAKGASLPRKSSQFNNSALARYLSMILYRSTGNADNAAVDRRYITQAFETQGNLYPFPEPATILDEELTVPKGMARINIISFTGFSPIKEERKVREYDEDGDYYFVFAYPVMMPRPSAVKGVRARITDEDGNTSIMNLDQIESIENIAIDTFYRKEAAIYARALLRGLGKSVTGAALNSAAKDVDEGFAAMMSLFTMVAQEMSEAADTRTTQYFPGNAYVTGLTVDPGLYDITIEYIDRKGSVIKTDIHKDVAVTEKGINLTESLCLQ